MAPHSSTLAWKIPWMESLESDTTERLHFHFSVSCIGEGNGNLLQCSCLENPRDGGAWWAAIYGVAQSLDLAAAAAELLGRSPFSLGFQAGRCHSGAAGVFLRGSWLRASPVQEKVESEDADTLRPCIPEPQDQPARRGPITGISTCRCPETPLFAPASFCP